MSKVKQDVVRVTAYRIRTYNDPAPILGKKREQIQRAIYICHDQEGEPHYHINLILKARRNAEEIRRWFVTNENPNVWCEADTGTFRTAIEYYKHNTDDAIAANKVKYDESLVQYFQCSAEDIDRYDSDDVSYAIVTDMLSGVPLYKIVERYGKAFCRYYAAYRTLCRDIVAGSWQEVVDNPFVDETIDKETGEIIRTPKGTPTGAKH